METLEALQIGKASSGLWFTKAESLDDWQRPPEKPGKGQTLFATGSGLISSDLSQPGSLRHLTNENDPNVVLTNEEYCDILRIFFSDIYPPSATLNPEEARSRYKRHVAIAEAYLSGTGVLSKALQCSLRSMVTGPTSVTEAEFITRAVGNTYAVATVLPLTAHAKEALKRQDEETAKDALVTIGNRLSNALKKAKTPEDCRHVMRVIEGHISTHKTAKKMDDVKQLQKWFDKAKKKCEQLVEHSGTMDDEDAEEAGKKDDSPFASHVIIATAVFSSALASALISDTVAREMQTIPAHPDFSIARVLKTNKDGTVTDVSTFDQIAVESVACNLAVMSTRNDAPFSGVWHEVNLKVDSVCCMAVFESFALIVDGNRARVVALPTGEPTAEEYIFYPSDQPVSFKVIGCDMTATHVAFLGLTPGQYTPIVVVHERPFLYSARRKNKIPRVFVMSLSVPCTTLAFGPTTDGQVQPLFFGLSDGTLFRVSIPTSLSAISETRKITLYPREGIVSSSSDGGEDAKPEADAKPEDATDDGSDAQEKKKAEHTPMIDVKATAKQLRASFSSWVVSTHPFGDGGHMRWGGDTQPFHRISVKGLRAVASGPSGIFVFKLDKQAGDKERVIHMQLGDVASFDFRGGLLAVLKRDTTINLFNMHTFKLETNIPPSRPVEGTKPSPPYTSSHCRAVSVQDERVMFVHSDGSIRYMEFKDAAFISSPYTLATPVSSEERAKSFLPPEPAQAQKGARRGRKKK